MTYDVEDRFEYAANCHCADCRRKTGAAFKPFAGVAIRHFSITSGAGAIQRFGETDHDAQCIECGAFLYSIVKCGTYVHVNFGGLVDTPSLRPTEHLFVGSKAPWYEIGDTLPRHFAHAMIAPKESTE